MTSCLDFNLPAFARASSKKHGAMNVIIASMELLESPVANDCASTLVRSSIICGAKMGKKKKKPMDWSPAFLSRYGRTGIAIKTEAMTGRKNEKSLEIVHHPQTKASSRQLTPRMKSID